MKFRIPGIVFLYVLISAFVCTGNAKEEMNLLWRIGERDQNNTEFALSPNGYEQFSEDAFFIMGESETTRDWPYVHPGPSDRWAGGRSHTFSIVFGVNQQLHSGQCRLEFDLLDTQSQAPPRLRIEVNGRAFEQVLPAGGGDESVFGHPERGKRHSFTIEFPVDLLNDGDNQILITTLSGCWFLYDALSLYTPSNIQLTPVTGRTFIERCKPISAIFERDSREFQSIQLSVRHVGEPIYVVVNVANSKPFHFQLTEGVQALEIAAPAVKKTTELDIRLETADEILTTRRVTLNPVRKMVVYVLPHSHTDIGYTEIQTAIEEKQVNNLLTGIEYARKTSDYPEGARFVWNVEVLWAADLYLQRMSETQRSEFYEAVKKGWLGLNGMYLNELTGLCRSEELLQLFRYSTQLAERCGVTIDSAMISDVPGYTWGLVTAMAQAGIKYFSTAPNYFDRIGDILVQWENKPFYWISPSGKEKVLVWIPLKGYALSHTIGKLSTDFVEEYQSQLNRMDYPYDIAYLRWAGHGDNAVPDMTICDFIKDWNSKYLYPKFHISTTSEAFRAFEKEYGDRLPEVRGDWTPYWEDGAGSSALETAMNRASSDRITQAETLWAMLNPSEFPASAFEEAWRNILLYSEHTWGAWCSVTDPENQMTKEQWDIKQSYALKADAQTRHLLDSALGDRRGNKTLKNGIDVFNTSSWPRTELVVLSKELSSAGDRVTDEKGQVVSSQRLSGGELAFMACDVLPFAARRYTVSEGKGGSNDTTVVQGSILDNGILRVRIDEQTGGIVELTAKDLDGNFVDAASGYALNEYLFLAGDDQGDLQKNGPVTISVKEKGPLVASLSIESSAPGCNALIREIRLTAGMDFVEIVNTVDKKRGPANPKPGDWKFAQTGGKESVNFAFPFNVNDGIMQLDIPLGVMKPEIDQIPSACKNWFTVGRWADVSNVERGITWATLDAPLVEIGEISATLLGSQTNPVVWRKHVEPTQALYSWAMNNHWGTNYRAYQEGPVTFRYALRPHRKFESDAASRFAIGLSQPLVVAPATEDASVVPRLRVEPDGALVTALKPSDDGSAWIVRLFGASGRDLPVKLIWSDPKPSSVWLSDTSENRKEKAGDIISLPAWDVRTLRVEFDR